MSEAEKSVEVEDVLSSIRRLVADRPRAEKSSPQPLNLAASRIEPPLTAQTDIDETMEELPIEEDIVLETPSFIPQEDVLETSEVELAPLPEIDTQNEDGPITFVQAINASIAEMSKSHEQPSQTEEAVDENTVSEELAVEDIAELAEDADSEARAAHVNAFLASEISMPSELGEPVTQKAEPFVLRADMVADEDEPPKEANLETSETEADFEDIADDAEEFGLSDDMEDNIIDDVMDTAVEATSGDTFIDEDTLREIVGELVRAELQGDLGDRITRNVRKLVRREIHHARASREIP